jgi:hypothetical protein
MYTGIASGAAHSLLLVGDLVGRIRIFVALSGIQERGEWALTNAFQILQMPPTRLTILSMNSIN